MRLNFETEYFAISYHNMQPSFDFITVSHKKQKEKNENNLEGKRINYAISLFTFLVALQARISGYFH